MPKILVRKCPFTDKLFQTRSGYRRHLLSLRKKKAEARARRKIARISRERIQKIRTDMNTKLAQIRTAEQLEKFVVENFHDLTIAYTNANIEKVAIIRKMKMEWFEFERINYSHETSNSHNCPRGGTTNWGGRKEGAPQNYPGFSGQMKWKVTGPKSAKNGNFSNRIEASHALSFAGIHTTTGCPGWDGNIGFQFFVDDFDGIAQEIDIATKKAKKEIFMARLKKGGRIYENDIINKHIRPIYEKQT